MRPLNQYNHLRRRPVRYPPPPPPPLPPTRQRRAARHGIFCINNICIHYQRYVITVIEMFTFSFFITKIFMRFCLFVLFSFFAPTLIFCYLITFLDLNFKNDFDGPTRHHNTLLLGPFFTCPSHHKPYSFYFVNSLNSFLVYVRSFLTTHTNTSIHYNGEIYALTQDIA